MFFAWAVYSFKLYNNKVEALTCKSSAIFHQVDDSLQMFVVDAIDGPYAF